MKLNFLMYLGISFIGLMIALPIIKNIPQEHNIQGLVIIGVLGLAIFPIWLWEKEKSK